MAVITRYPAGQSGQPAATQKKYIRPCTINIGGASIPLVKVNENGTLYADGNGTVGEGTFENHKGEPVRVRIVSGMGGLYLKVDDLEGIEVTDQKVGGARGTGKKLF